MKILIIGLTTEMGGTENYIYSLMKKINFMKYKFDFLIDTDNELHTPYEKEINELINDGENHFYYCKNLKKHYVLVKKWLKNFYDKEKYDLIYLNATTAAKAAYCRYAISVLHTPMITHSHRSKGHLINHTLYKSYINKYSIYKLACSENAATWMYGREAVYARIIANGIESERFAFSYKERNKIRQELGISENTIVIGHVGRFSEEKNHKMFIEIAKRLDSHYLFMCVGDGPLKNQILKLVKKNNLEDRFRILASRKDVYKCYSAMDLFMMPSLNEGFPIVSIEAQCSGLRCIFSDTVSKETNICKENLYFPLNQIDQWIDGITHFGFKRYDGVKVIKKAGFDMSCSVKQIESIFESVYRDNKERNIK